MNKFRLRYFIVFLFIIFLGILSRKLNFIPLWIGDCLYAVMMYFLVRIFFVNQKAIQILVLSLLICFSIELLQLYQAGWMAELRKTLFGRYVLGQGFLWSDLLAYTFGAAIAFLTEKITLKVISQKSA